MARVTTALLTAGLLFVTACGGDDGGSETGGGENDDETTTTAAGGEGHEEAQAFCDEVTELAQGILSNLSQGGEEPSQEQQQQLVQEMRSVEPPAEIADDWNTILDSTEEAIASGQMPSATDPELQEASTNLSEFSGEHCGGG